MVTALARRMVMAMVVATFVLAAAPVAQASAGQHHTTRHASKAGKAGTAAVSSGAGWSKPTVIDKGVELASILCHSPSFCVAVDNDGNAFTFTGASWSKAVRIDPAAGTVTNQMASVSCPTTSFCAAGDQTDNVTTFDGSSWSAIDPLNGAGASPTGFFSVSCPTTSFCMAVDGHRSYFTYNGSTWSAPQNIDPDSNGISSEITGVSCASAAFCVAVDGAYHSVTYNGTTWSQPQSDAPAADLTSGNPTVTAVSCPTTTFCVGVGDFNNVRYLVEYNGTTWSQPQNVETGATSLPTVSCPSRSSCMVLDVESGYSTYNGSSWSKRQLNGPLLVNDLSCPSSSFCAAVTSLGATYEWKS